MRIKLRDSLVRARVALINSVRFSLKSLGYAVGNPSSERFHKVAMETLPEVVREMIAPSVQALAELSAMPCSSVRSASWPHVGRTRRAVPELPRASQLRMKPQAGPSTAQVDMTSDFCSLVSDFIHGSPSRG